MTKSFNVIDQPWIPVAGSGLVSLRQIFSNHSLTQLGGNPVQKIAVMKLLLAIAQAACTPKDEDEWQAVGAEGMAKKCLDYLDKWYDRFDLYDPERPFLQMPAVVTAQLKPYGAVLADISTGNTTVLLQSQVEAALTDADKALMLVLLMGFALGGKKTDNSVVLTAGYAGKTNDKGRPSTGKAGSAVAHMGMLHNVLLGSTPSQSIWLNLLTESQTQACNAYPAGIGVAPWEQMPTGEDDTIARKLRASLIGRLVPMGRFCLLAEHGLHYSEGIVYPSYKEGGIDPSIAINASGKVLWCDPERRPWRELTSLLSLLDAGQSKSFQSLQINSGLGRIRKTVDRFGLWSGGLKVSSNAGEQYASGSDDYVESMIWLDTDVLGKNFFSILKQEMMELDQLAKVLYGRVVGFYKCLQKSDGGDLAALATTQFWQLVERDFQQLVDHCAMDQEHVKVRQKLRRRFAQHVHDLYDQYCPMDSARQLEAWASNRPNTHKYVTVLNTQKVSA